MGKVRGWVGAGGLVTRSLSPGPHSLQPGKSSSTGNLLDKEDLAIPPPDYGTASRAFPAQTAGTFKQRPYSVAVPAFSQVSTGQGPGLEGAVAGWARPQTHVGTSIGHAWGRLGDLGVESIHLLCLP